MRAPWTTTACLLGAVLAAGQEPASEDSRPPDVLLIYLDDVNDWVGHLGGHPQASTPAIDRLAERGIAFTNAHAPAPVCNQSRTSVLGGVRPTTVAAWGSRSWVETLEGLTALPAVFAAHGYVTVSTGKIFHGKAGEGFDEHHRASTGLEKELAGPYVDLGMRYGARMLDWKAIEEAEERTGDYQRALWAAERLQCDDEVPLFIAVGFLRPHLPWYVPRAYFDAHPLDEVVLPEVPHGELADVPRTGRRLVNSKAHGAVTSNELWEEAVQAYLANVSFVDAQVGRVLDALERSPRADRTIVVLTSDHGWHLGEKQHWHKQTLWEESTRVPFVLATPGYEHAGARCSRAVDTLSLYATLCDLAGLPVPEHVEGVSLAPLVRDPEADWDGVALTTFVGHNAIRTERYRYIRYADGGEELYDHEADPGEHVNLAEEEAQRDLLRTFRKQLKELVPR
jgi:arylsulfatase A-like enzyme